MQQNSSVMRSKLDNLMIQFKMLPANQIEHGQRILDKFTNSSLTNYLTTQDVRQINQLLRKKRSVGMNLGLLRTKKIGDLYPNLQEFQLQQQYHSQGFKKIKQTRLNIQREIAQSKIVDNVLKVPSLPEKITYKSLQSMTYFENYRGFNNGGNAPGKNILNIGERHYGTDNGFTEFQKFIDTLVAKNKYVGNCLDFVYESPLSNIVGYYSPLFQKQGLEQIPKAFRQNKSSTLVTLRYFFLGKTIVKGFRAHHTDTRLGFDGFLATLIAISGHFDFNAYYNRIILQYIYDFYQPHEDKTIIEMILFNTLLNIDADNVNNVNEEKQFIKDIKQMYSKNPSGFEKKYGNYDDIIKYFERKLQSIDSGINCYKMFIVSIKNFVQKAVGQKLKQKGNILDEKDMVNVNREMYYKYLEEKGSDKNSVENEIFFNKRFDLKFRKQINNLDARYFKSDPKQTIMLYYLDYVKMSDQLYFYDIQTICRVFRKFDESKERYSSCDQNDKSMRNVIIYSGNKHTQNINKFLQALPVMEVNEYTGKLDMGTNVKLLGTPVLCFGKVGDFSELYDIPGMDDRYRPRQLSDEIEIPSNYDYFDYNKKIIKNLKIHYNVLHYTQLSKAIKKEEEERKMKQQQQLKRKEERKMKQQQQQLNRKEERKRKE